uniref:S1 domain-containing protein n=1 Tax=Heterorhabditis bacteriophora TaxID=37862 RepID=A0A1I7XJ15_HETBA
MWNNCEDLVVKIMESKVVIPGEILLPSAEGIRPGKGTYELHGHIFASLAGFVYMKDDQMNDKNIQVLEVRRTEERHDHVIPFIGCVVTAKILNIGSRFAKCELLCVEDATLSSNSEFTAILRREDIRAVDKDKIDLAKCIQPGDIILARVVSFGDNQSSFILSTAEDQLGVVSAVGESGERMVPFDWVSVKGLQTGILEPRKVAQVPSLSR